MASEFGHGAVALADHQTVAGNKDMAKWAEKYGLECINGSELLGQVGKTAPHMTAYGFDETDNKIREFFRANYEIAYKASKMTFDTCMEKKLFGGITWQDVLDDAPEGSWICNEQIFRSLKLRAGYTQADYQTWRPLWVQTLKTCGAPHPFVIPEAKELFDMIHNAGGVIFLAHPMKLGHLIPELYKLGLDGAEWNHPDLDEASMRCVLDFAKEHPDFLLSGGTDHTGLLGNDMDRLPVENPKAICPLPTNAIVFNGATKAQFDAIKARIGR